MSSKPNLFRSDLMSLVKWADGDASMGGSDAVDSGADGVLTMDADAAEVDLVTLSVGGA